MIAGRRRTAAGGADSSTLSGESWLYYAALLYFILASVLAIHRGWIYDINGSRTCDFIAPYSGARCLLHGCNPYDSVDLQREYFAAHGNPAALDSRHDWKTLLPVYPPTTFLVITPFTLLDYPDAQVAWFYLSAILFCTSVGLLVQFVPRDWAWLYFVLAGITLSSANTDFLLGPGNPSTFAIAFGSLAVWAFYIRKSEWLAILMLAAALAMKPHMAVAIFLFLLLRKASRRTAVFGGAIAICLLVASAIRLQVATGLAWWQKFQAAVTSGIQPGGTNSPGPGNPSAPHILNLQAVTSLFVSTPAHYNRLALAITLALTIFWLFALARAGVNRINPLLGVAGLLCLSLLPLYHRDYDCRLLVLTLPPMVLLLRGRHRRMGILLALASVPLLFSQTTLHMQHLLNASHRTDLTRLQTLVYLRQQPLALLLLAFLWPLALYLVGRNTTAIQPPPPSAPSGGDEKSARLTERRGTPTSLSF